MTLFQQQQAWENIRNRIEQPINQKEQLFKYYLARKNAPRSFVVSRKRAKHTTTGKWYKDSRVIPQVSLERVF